MTSLSEVSRESVDSGFDQNKSELSVSVLAVSLKMLSDRDGLLDQVVKIFGDLRSATFYNTLPNKSNHITLPFFFKILRILRPVRNLTWGTPCWSLKVTPI